MGAVTASHSPNTFFGERLHHVRRALTGVSAIAGTVAWRRISMKRFSTLLLAFLMVTSAAPAADTANDLFQQALVKERTEGNLPEAIKLYQRIVEKYPGNHKVAAEALLQLAGCQSKLGDVQARKSLERLVRDFADQKETVAEAR